MPQEQGNNRRENGTYRPGHSGNPGGRPKGRKSLYTRVRARLDRSLPDGRTIADLVAEVIVREALKGNWRALKEIFDREDGAIPRQAKDPNQLSIAELLELAGDDIEDRGSDDR